MAEVADAAVHDATGVGPVGTVAQLVVTKDPLVPGVQLATPVAGVVLKLQLICT